MTTKWTSLSLLVLAVVLLLLALQFHQLSLANANSQDKLVMSVRQAVDLAIETGEMSQVILAVDRISAAHSILVNLRHLYPDTYLEQQTGVDVVALARTVSQQRLDVLRRVHANSGHLFRQHPLWSSFVDKQTLGEVTIEGTRG